MPLGGTSAAEELASAPEQPAFETPVPETRTPDKPAPGIASEAPTGEVPGEAPGMPPENGTETNPVRSLPERPAPAPTAASGPASELTSRPALDEGRGTLVSVPDASGPSPATATAAFTPLRLMVQIAAVSRAADAQTLASALQHDGFAATVRTSPADTLFHVQIGPFQSFTAAKAMRARLAGNGYNAFIKP